uniref:Cathepsin propeptide inhibitor domain-containing protein n=1 Tax=Ascaris lumbricoides TaxID=6252 RepID=A0A9J2PME4_ASCLU
MWEGKRYRNMFAAISEDFKETKYAKRSEFAQAENLEFIKNYCRSKKRQNA